METSFIVPIFALITLLAFTCFALVSKKKVEDRRKNDAMPKSTLAADAPSDGKPVDV